MGAGNGKFLTGLAVFRMGAVRQDFLSETKQEQSCFSGPKKAAVYFRAGWEKHRRILGDDTHSS